MQKPFIPAGGVGGGCKNPGNIESSSRCKVEPEARPSFICRLRENTGRFACAAHLGRSTGGCNNGPLSGRILTKDGEVYLLHEVMYGGGSGGGSAISSVIDLFTGRCCVLKNVTRPTRRINSRGRFYGF